MTPTPAPLAVLPPPFRRPARARRAFLAQLALTLLALAIGGTDASAQDSTAAPRRTWTSDRIQLRVGDIVTVLIDERTLASANLRENGADRRSRDMSAQASAPGGTQMAGSIGSGQDVSSRRDGESVRANNFRSEVSARVVAISPGGMLQLEGEKELLVDKSRQTVQISGWVRPNDIAVATNTVESWRLADARIAYAQRGRLGKPRTGLLTRLVGWFWP